MKTFMFPGQGSQSRGMGGSLFDEFAELTEKADKILGYSIKELCLNDPRRELNKTQFTQPALYVVNALSYLKRVAELGRKPDFVVGHSLGEFNALFAAECFDFEAGLKLVKKRGELMSQATDGGMAAILNASKQEIEATLQANGLSGIDLANYNTPSQIVISGLIDEIGRAQAFFQVGEVLYYPLNTSGAFHSRYMRPAQEKFEAYLKKFKFSELTIPVIANVTATAYQNHTIMDNLASQISSTVRWCETIQYLMSLATAAEPMEFEEIGNGDVLTKLIATIKQQTPVAESTAEHLEIKPLVKGIASLPQVAQPRESKHDSPPKPIIAAEEAVSAWNKRYPIGTRVKSSIADYGDLQTRTAAVVLFGHRAAVYMKDYKGYFDLTEVTPV